ncbi:DUF2905 domain-containing protein [Desulfurispirillum indicum]|uniref:DUF2905 domain-containing protein n=1 Tax=Desulfurispirillum indicum (strain ATCC BAA-1389 / DSM 22839 / S5) TaxID=653733 RepID=E6W364_DESIS|nr:DUF2905 domain-containing protein [Desulfurispirillum indicum]ADU65725.1 hypothetical protein Selin_0990 [Desulfurispirillum indicum S5]UCZ57653.1 DUF2905 domain-containing protein [Desulfurispirillum indicum]
MQKTLVIAGIILLVAGFLWPLLQKAGFFRLPGDIVIERENFRFYFPVTSMVIISGVVSVIFWILRR